ncbi:hypothetical protein MRX96_013113 [Rhipicephalus microplus]
MCPQSNAKLWMAVVAVIVVGAILFTLVRIVRRRRPSALHGESCSSESCQRYTELLRDAVDSNSAPCDNYYKHVCSVWTESHDGPVQSITLGHFIDNAIEGIKSLPSIHDVVTRKGTVFFASCLSVANVSNVPNVKKLLADGDITWPKRNDQPDFLNALFYMSRILFMPVFFNFKVSPNGKVLKVSHSEDFSEIFLLLHQHMKTLHLKKYLTVTYEAFDTLDETRLGEIIARFDQLIPVIENITGWEDANVYNAESFLGITPSVPRDRWDTVLDLYYVTSVANLSAVLVEGVSQFKAFMKLHQYYGEAAVNDIVEALCVQSLLRFTSFDIISTFHTSSDVAGEWLQRKCFFSTFLFFGFDVDRYFLSKSGDALSNVRQLAKRVRQEFFAVLEGGDNEPDSHGGKRQNASEYYFNNLFVVLNPETALAYPKVYATYPNMTDDPLMNWKILNEHYLDLPRSASANFPYYEPNAHVGAVLGGLGQRFAAAVFYDYAESQANSSDFYRRNQDCLANISGLEKPDYDLQGAIAAVPVIYSIFNKAREDSGNPFVRDLPPFRADVIPFMTGCYLLCGDANGEKMCNVPLKHSEDFARVYKCAPGSEMNPVKKCAMVP